MANILIGAVVAFKDINQIGGITITKGFIMGNGFVFSVGVGRGYILTIPNSSASQAIPPTWFGEKTTQITISSSSCGLVVKAPV